MSSGIRSADGADLDGNPEIGHSAIRSTWSSRFEREMDRS
jgi:hypothetical protein